MKITRKQLVRIIREEAGLGPHPTRPDAFDASEDFDALLDDIMNAAKRYGITPGQVLQTLNDAFEN